jgi:hypothetical protein
MSLLPLGCLYSLPERINMQSRLASFLSCLGLAACALNARPGDGLVSDGLSQDYQFGTIAQPGGGGARGGAGAADAGEKRTCKNAASFIQQAIPRFITDCVECHDGTKLKATLAFDLIDAESTDPAKLALTCDLTLTSAVKNEDRVQSPLLTEVDPARTDLEHEFKFPDPASFAAFRDGVMLWLQTE